MDVVVTDHHSPRADGLLPDAPLVHPAVCGLPVPRALRRGRRARARARAARRRRRAPRGPRARRARHGRRLRAAARGEPAARPRRPACDGHRPRSEGLRALMKVAKADPARIDARAIGFRLAPRLNAAGRLYRADAGVELLLTGEADARPRDRRGARPCERRAPPRRAAHPRSRPRAWSPRPGSATRTSSLARAGTRASSGSSPRASPSATTGRACSSRSTATRAPARAARSPRSTCSAGCRRARSISPATAGTARRPAARSAGRTSRRSAPRSRPTRPRCCDRRTSCRRSASTPSSPVTSWA